jgi:hypothetical protein
VKCRGDGRRRRESSPESPSCALLEPVPAVFSIGRNSSTNLAFQFLARTDPRDLSSCSLCHAKLWLQLVQKRLHRKPQELATTEGPVDRGHQPCRGACAQCRQRPRHLQWMHNVSFLSPFFRLRLSKQINPAVYYVFLIFYAPQLLERIELHASK